MLSPRIPAAPSWGCSALISSLICFVLVIMTGIGLGSCLLCVEKNNWTLQWFSLQGKIYWRKKRFRIVVLVVFFLVRLFEAKLHVAVISGVVLGCWEQPLLCQGLQVTSKLLLAAQQAQVPWCPSISPPLKLFAHVIEAQNCQNWCELIKAHPVCAPVHLELPVQLGWAVFLTVSEFLIISVFLTVSVFLTISVFLAGLADKCHKLSCFSLPWGMWWPWLGWSQCCICSFAWKSHRWMKVMTSL